MDKKKIGYWESVLRESIGAILDDRLAPSWMGYQDVYTVMFQYSMYDKERAARFVLSLVEESIPKRRMFMSLKLYNHYGIEHSVAWHFVDDETRKQVIDMLQTETVFRHLQQTRYLKHQCFIDVCFGLQPAERAYVIEEASKRLLVE